MNADIKLGKKIIKNPFGSTCQSLFLELLHELGGGEKKKKPAARCLPLQMYTLNSLNDKPAKGSALPV